MPSPMDELDGYQDDHECPNCGGNGLVWGCFESCCVCDDDDGLGCAPMRCDWCRPSATGAEGGGDE